MNAITKFEEMKLPSFLAKKQLAADLNAELAVGVGGGYPVISIKGKSWSISRSGEVTVLQKEDEDGEPVNVQSINVVILRAGPGLSKVYYKGGYVEGSAEKPDCYSHDGVKPASDATSPQHKSCATCPMNQWGSKVSENGNKIKACSDNRRLAVAPAGLLDDPMQLRVPPASLKPLAEYGNMLAKREVPVTAVVTKLSFGPESSPTLVFKATSFLSEEQFEQAMKVRESDIVQQIVGLSHAPTSTALDDEEDEDVAEPVPPPTARPVEKPAPAPAPEAHAKSRGRPKATATVSAEEVGDVLGEVAAAPAPEPEKPVATKMEGLAERVGSVLSTLGFDD